MNLSLRKISICGRFPFVRLKQILDNPSYLIHLLKKNLIYKRSKNNYIQEYASFTFLTGQETLEHLIVSGKSLARFSDGEFEQITGGGIYPPDSDWCQQWSKSLADGLVAVLSSNDNRLMVAVDPPSTFLASKDSVHSIRFEYNMWVDMRRLMWRYLNKSQLYGHSHLFMKANCPDFSWTQLRAHLSSKDILIAVGNVNKLQHLSLGRSTNFIECGTENAYERKETIKKNIRKAIKNLGLIKKDTIVLACLGPTACIIAKEFLDEDIVVWDTGHMFEFAKKDFLENVFL